MPCELGVPMLLRVVHVAGRRQQELGTFELGLHVCSLYVHVFSRCMIGPLQVPLAELGKGEVEYCFLVVWRVQRSSVQSIRSCCKRVGPVRIMCVCCMEVSAILAYLGFDVSLVRICSESVCWCAMQASRSSVAASRARNKRFSEGNWLG